MFGPSIPIDTWSYISTRSLMPMTKQQKWLEKAKHCK